MYDIIFIGNDDNSFLKLKERFPTAKRVLIKDDIQVAFNEAQRKSFTKMFWVVWDDVNIVPEFKFDYKATEWGDRYIHLFLNGSNYDGVGLFPKTASISKKELSCRFFVNKKETGIAASKPKAYDIFYINTYDEYLSALETSTTEMFWVVWNDVIVNTDFKFDLYFSHHNQYDRKMNHVFKNSEYYDGIILASKNKVISKREFDYRFLADKKEWDIVASTPKPFDIFYINTYDEYLSALETSATEMFWIVWNDIIVDSEFKFDYYVPVYDSFHRNITHVFKNKEYYDGVCLFSKSKKVSDKEFDYRFYVSKKETGIVASTPKPYDIFYINTYDEYLSALETSTTEMFWIVPDDVVVNPEFKFDLYFSHHNRYDRKMNHVFKNGEHYDGIILASKNKVVSNREFEYRFLADKKEWDIVASTPKPYDIFYINTYDEYLSALETSTTEMFWVVFDDIVVNDDFKFDLYFSHHDQYDRKMNHVFKNGKYYDGIILASKNKVVSNREFEYRFLADKKEWDVDASKPKLFDIVFISYFEKFADNNYRKLKERVGSTHDVYRVNEVKGIHNAHRAAAELVKTDMFWVVDADAILEPNFNFEFPQVVHHDTYTKSVVHVWRSRNPINDLEYGYGGVKLLPRKLTLNMDMSKPDMTTSISASFKAMPSVSNISEFNTDPFTTWRSAFRECVKLASKTIQGQVDKETEERLDIWCTVGKDKPFGEYAISGAIAGRKYGQENAGNIPALALINDYDWLKSQFEQTH